MKQGFIKATYIDHMGSDLTVVNAARTSFGKESTWDYGPPTEHLGYNNEVHYRQEKILKPADAKLIRFLARGYRTLEWDALIEELRQYGRDSDYDNLERALLEFKNKAQHWAPFAHPQLQMRVQMPIFLARQMVKHQVGGVWSEVSRRYVDDGLEFWLPSEWHSRPDDVKQGSGDLAASQDFCISTAERITAQAHAAYTALRAEGVAPEEARIVLPHNLMTTVVWTGSLLFWSRVCNQRLDSHAQLAAQELARLISNVVQPLFPVSWAELVHA